MDPIMQVRQDMLERMQHMRDLAASMPVRPAADAQGAASAGSISDSFLDSLRAVDAQQQRASAATSAVSAGTSDDLTGAMIESQKASVSFSALLQVRNKLATAFDDIIKMPL